MCTTCSKCVTDVYVGVKTHLCNMHTRTCTSAHNTCKVPATLTAKKNVHIYTYTLMYTHAYAHENTCACMTSSTRWSTDTKTHNLCTNMHTHTHTHVYKRIDVQRHTHMHIYTYIMSAHVQTYTYIHTHTKCTYERTQSTSETTARQRLRGQPNLTPRSSGLLHVRITTARRPDHIRLSALVRRRSTQFIVHASSQLGHAGPWPPKTRSFFCHLYMYICMYILVTNLHHYCRRGLC